MIFDDKGGRGGQDPPKKDDISYEEPLTGTNVTTFIANLQISSSPAIVGKMWRGSIFGVLGGCHMGCP